MTDALLKYVDERLKAGHSVSIIKSDLLRQGYSPALIEGVIESAVMGRSSASSPAPHQILSSGQARHSHTIFLIIACILIIAGAAVLLKSVINTPQALLDVKLSPDKLSYSAGDALGFSLEVLNMGSKERFDITLVYKIFDSKDSLMLSNEETIAISTTTSHHKNIDLPTSLRPGRYLFKVFANYDDKVATSAFSFDIVKKEEKPRESCSDGLKNQDETHIDCGGVCRGYWYNSICNDEPQPGTTPIIPIEEPQESCSDGIKNRDENGIDCGGLCGGYWYDGSCHTTQKPAATIETPKGTDFVSKLLEVRSKAKSAPAEAKAICEGMGNDDAKDKCFKVLAEESADNVYCSLIKNYDLKDECYSAFFLKGDYSVCEKLSLYENRKNCEQLRDLSLVQEQINNEDYAGASDTLANSESLDFFND